MATSLSVGYAAVFPVTAIGKAIGAVGTAALDAKLDAILVELRRMNAAG